MSFLYRHGLLISRKQPYIDWANRVANDSVPLSDELSRHNRSLYLVPEVDGEPDLAELVDEFWSSIFDEELSGWVLDTDQWPEPRTREMFDDWFVVELNDSVFDLTPEEPLTQDDMDLADLSEMMERCASCGIEVAEGDGRLAGFKLNNRASLEAFEGRVLPLPLEADGDQDVVLALVTTRESDAAKAGDDVLVRVCSSRCEKVMRSTVPKALRRVTRTLGASEDLNE
jgi:hypothetical protein